MLQTVLLILPILIPSWRFFKTIEPSPRVQWALLPNRDAAEGDWQEFRPRPATLTGFQMFCRLFWNPTCNDNLFVVSCAERIAEHATAHSINEIKRRVLKDVEQIPIDTTGRRLRFRLVFVSRDQAGLSQEVVFISEPFSPQRQLDA